MAWDEEPVPLVVPSPMILVNPYEFFLVRGSFVQTQIQHTLRVASRVKGVVSTDRRYEVSLKSLAVVVVVVAW